MSSIFSVKRVTVITIVAVALVAVGGYLWRYAQTTTVLTHEAGLTVDDMVRQAQLVVIGIPTKSKPRLVKDEIAGRLIFTDWTFEVREVLKGEVPKILTVTVPGGERFGERTFVDQSSGFKNGNEYLLYLTHVSEAGWWVPLSPAQSVFGRNGETFRSQTGREQTVAEARAAIRQAEAR